MRPELQAKLIQHLNKKKGDQGFTLVELLVVIVIIGILTAIALPSFLNQTAKAKQSEAKQNVSTVIKAQQSLRTERSAFTTVFNDLALGNLQGTAGTSSTTVYDYTLTAGTPANDVSVGARSKDTAVRSYMGRTDVASVGATTQIQWTSTICENNAPGTTAVTAMTTTVAGNGAGCATGSTAVQ